MSQFIEMFSKMGTTPIKEYVLDSYPGEWGVEDTDGNGVRVIRTTNFTNTGKLNLADVVRRNIDEKKVSRKRILKYDTILERSGGTNDNPVGRVVLFEEDGVFLCNNFTQVLRFKDIDPRFAFYALFYFYQTNRTAVRSMGSKTTGIQNLNMSKYLEIGIPNATTEQQKVFIQITEQADKSKFVDFKSQFIEMQRCSNRSNTLGDFIARCTPDRCGNRGDLPTLSVTKERAIVFQDERFDACVASKDKSNYIIAPRGYLVQGIHIDESNFGIQNLVDEGIVSPAYKLWKFKNNDAIPELVEYYLRSEMAIKYFQRKFLGATVQRRQVIRKEDFLALPLNLPELDDQMKYYQFYRQADKSKFVDFKSQFIEMFSKMGTTPIKEYVLDSYPGEWGVEDTDGNGVRVIRTTNFTNTGKLNLADVVRRNIDEKKVSRKRILKYDTILERSGGTNDNPVGRVVLFEEDGVFLCNNFTQVLRFKDIDPRFAFYALFYFYQTNRTAVRSMGSKTTGIQNLNMSKYLEIGIPNATTEQQKVFIQITEQADKSKYFS